MSKKPFRFSVQTLDATSASSFRGSAQKAESLGFSAFHMSDHYLGPGPALEGTNCPPTALAAIPAMAMAAEATRTIKIGCRVLCTVYRPAPVLVKEAMTIDFLSDGRLELGLGAGWMQCEFDAMGIPLESPGRRIDVLEETIQLAKASMGSGILDIRGKHVHAVGYEAVPKPPRGKVPLMIGGGAPRVLRLAGREADIVSINFNNRAGVIGADGISTSTAEETAKKIGWVKDGAGARFDQIEIEIGAYIVVVTDDQKSTAEAMAPMFGLSVEGLLEFPHALIGSVDYICDELQRRRELYGISYINVQESVVDSFAPVVARLSGK